MGCLYEKHEGHGEAGSEWEAVASNNIDRKDTLARRERTPRARTERTPQKRTERTPPMYTYIGMCTYSLGAQRGYRAPPRHGPNYTFPKTLRCVGFKTASSSKFYHSKNQIVGVYFGDLLGSF